MKSNTGIALFLVLWVLTLLMVIVGEFSRTMRTEINITQNFLEDHEAYYLALAGFNLAAAGLLDKTIIPDSINDMQIHQAMAQSENNKDFNFWRINTDIPEIPFADGSIKVHIENNSGRININQVEQPELLKLLVSRMNLDETRQTIIVDSILDWLDKDDLHRLHGAENDYYQSLPEPYRCRNGKILTIDEIRLIRGIDDQVWENLKPLIVIFPQEAHDSQGAGRLNLININAAAAPVLAILPGMTSDMILNIMEYRREKDFKAVSEVLEIVGSEAYQQFSKYLTVELSPYYTITAEGIVGDGAYRRGIRAFIFLDKSSSGKFEILKWMDRI